MYQKIKKSCQKCNRIKKKKKIHGYKSSDIYQVPQRYILAIMAFLAITNIFQLRACLNVTITQMVVKRSNNDTLSIDFDPFACPDDNIVTSDNDESSNDVTNIDQFDWDEETQGLILSSIYWGFMFSEIPGGLLADKFGGKYVLEMGILGTSIITILLPAVANAGVGWLLTANVIKGMAEGLTYPAIGSLLARWAPLQESGLTGSLVFAGAEIGTVTGTLLSGYLLDAYNGNWPVVFYVFGGIGLLWCVFGQLLCYSEPEKHPFITDKEKLFLSETLGGKDQDITSPPWRHILTSFPIWAIIFAHFAQDWAFYTMITDLPKYMTDVLKYSIGNNGVLSSIPFLVMWLVSLGSGWISDQAIKRKWASVTVIRKILTTICLIGPSAGLMAASYAGCNRTVAVILFTVTMGLMGTFYPGVIVNTLDLSPNYAGTIMALCSGAGNISGMISPYLVGFLTPNHTLIQWRSVFWINAAINIVSLVIFLWGASGEMQPWNDIKETGKRNSIFSNDITGSGKLWPKFKKKIVFNRNL